MFSYRSFQVKIWSVCVLLAAVALSVQARPAEKGAPIALVWPNNVSRANSDDWIRLHHDQIRQMRPRVLVLNFVNGLSAGEARQKVERLIAAIREGSRYHGYGDPQAPAFLDYQIAKIVNLTDPQPLPPDRRLDGNSSFYPRVPNWKEGLNFRYGELFGPRFARFYGFPDSQHPGRYLTLADLVNRGIIHEVWFLAKQGNYGAPFECTEVKQAYDAGFHKIPGKWMQAGNGGTDEQPWIGRSLRILFINAERGPGCAMESLSHAIEGTSNSGAIPYFTRYFVPYAMFDLKRRYGMPFNSLYERQGGTEVSYPTPDSMVYTWQGKQYTVHPYIPAGGSVHFTPTGRRDYDMDNPASIYSTIEHYGLRDGPGGKDRAELWNDTKFFRYRQLANDCMGPWLVYWRQNFPGLGNHARDDSGRPMKNWWPFLFY
ncbi:MAG TPA: hypothetical protein VKT32_03330 [Chthonomonadaceae bacterium]|nr:hypothetical protein [Chthonomonadaceae bacterium]